MDNQRKQLDIRHSCTLKANNYLCRVVSLWNVEMVRNKLQ